MGIQPGKFDDWKQRYGKVNEHNGWIPRDHWLTPDEKRAILAFHHQHPLEGYRRLTVEDARRIVTNFVRHYNEVRLHSALGYVTPATKLAGREQEVFAHRDATKTEAAHRSTPSSHASLLAQCEKPQTRHPVHYEL